MAVSGDGGGKDELKTQFVTREGIYRLSNNWDYLRPARTSYTTPQQASPSVRISFVTLPESSGESSDNICFNYGRELYVYVFKGVKKYTSADLPKPVDKKIYKGTNPTCHDFNQLTATSDSASLLVGFSTGQILLVDPIRKDLTKLYNEERLIDKTKVTCIKWVPGSTSMFLASHSSGQLYLYNEELPCGVSPPHYQPFKHGDGFAISTCKTRSTRNPLYRWVIGPDNCPINELAFSPCGTHLAVVSQDGFLRVFHYDTMELEGVARSYFGGFLCVCWSPDGRYVVVGGEDDLVTVWSFPERRIVARGQGHRSWVSVVAFDPFAANTFFDMDACDSSGGQSGASGGGACYRLGSVGQDTQLCLWDITEDVVLQRTAVTAQVCVKSSRTSNGSVSSGSGNAKQHVIGSGCASKQGSSLSGSGGSGSGVSSSGGKKQQEPQNENTSDPLRLIGTAVCPRFDDCPVLEPLICKKVAHERLTALVFREDCFVMACQDGFVYTWARPVNKCASSHVLSSPTNMTQSLDRGPSSTIV